MSYLEWWPVSAFEVPSLTDTLDGCADTAGLMLMGVAAALRAGVLAGVFAALVVGVTSGPCEHSDS